MNHSRARPPTRPTAAPTSICKAKVPVAWASPVGVRPPAAIRLAIKAMPTGSLAPDSPSRMVPLRPSTWRRPSTEKTTVGSVGASAVATSSETYQLNPKAACSRAAPAMAVRKVPATPTIAMGARAVRKRLQPIRMPPSKSTHTRATVTTRLTVLWSGACTTGTTSTASAAAMKTSAGSGILIRSVARLDTTAAKPTAAVSRTSAPNVSVSVIGHSGIGHAASSADQTSRLAARNYSCRRHPGQKRVARSATSTMHSC